MELGVNKVYHERHVSYRSRSFLREEPFKSYCPGVIVVGRESGEEGGITNTISHNDYLISPKLG